MLRRSLLLLLAGCGPAPRPAVVQSEEALIVLTEPERPRLLPEEIETEDGRMSVEVEYIPGVVHCELGGSDEGAALEAQAVASRTYLYRYLQRRGLDAEVPLTSRFQCWKAGASQRARDAARYTADIILQFRGKPISANYVAGARALTMDCRPRSPEDNGYDHESWDEMRDLYLEARAEGRKRPFTGPAWTEVVVTRNEGKRGDDVAHTPMGRRSNRNRGAMGQWAAICLARDAGYEVYDILRYFYGDDIELSRPLPALEPAGLTGTESANDFHPGG